MFLFELMNLAGGYRKYFEIVPALSDELRDEAYRIRHAVYCEELGWDPVTGEPSSEKVKELGLEWAVQK